MENVFVDIGVILIFSLIGSIWAIKHKSPTVIGLLLAGAIIGPNALALVHSSEIISSFSELGAILLLFTIGIGFSISHMVQQSFRALMIASFKMGLVFLISYLFSLLFGLSVSDALIIGLILSITSTAIFASLIDREHKDRPEVKLLFAELIVEDVIGIILLTVISSMKIEAIASISTDILLPIAFSLVFLGAAYIIFERLVRWFMWYIDSFNNADALIMAAFCVAAVLTFTAKALGLSFGIGAFLAGSLVASVPVFKKVEHLLIPFNTVFASFFFFAIGMLFDWKAAFASLWLLLALNIINLFAKFGGTYLSTYLLGINSRGAVFSGLAMLSVGEFSILIAHEAAPLSSLDLVSLTAATVLISSIASTRLLKSERQIHEFLFRLAPASERAPFRSLSTYLRNLIAYIEPGGRGFRKFVEHGSKLLFYASLSGIIVGLAFIASRMAGNGGIVVAGATPRDIVHILGLLLFLAPGANALRELKEMFETIAEAFLQNEYAGMETGKRAKRGLMLFVFFFLCAFLTPPILAFISLPPIFYSAAIIPFAISILFLWDASRTAGQILKDSPIKSSLKTKLFERRKI